MSNIFQIIFSELYSEFVTILSLMKFDNKIQLNITQGISSKIADDYLDKFLGNKIWQSPLIIDFTNNSDETLFFIRDNKDKILSYYNSGMLELSNIAFYKNEGLIPFEDCSSGEKHLIFSLSGILCHIKPNSLVLIDEPEISLHPEWQTRYIDLIKTIFQKYSSCHFLIASHSHYLVSDLEPSTSSIVFMNRTISEASPHAELLPYSTYAWSAENVIYNIFGVRTTRNFYFEADLRKLIDLMNSDDGTGSNVDEVHGLVSKLKKLIFDESDPLNIILNQAQEFCNVYKKIDSKIKIPKSLKIKLEQYAVAGGWNSKASVVEKFKEIAKRQLEENQQNRCAYCELPLLSPEIDHIAPKGGPKRPKYVEYTFMPVNLVLACHDCNSAGRKGQINVVQRLGHHYTDSDFSILHPYLDDPKDFFKFFPVKMLLPV